MEEFDEMDPTIWEEATLDGLVDAENGENLNWLKEQMSRSEIVHLMVGHSNGRMFYHFAVGLTMKTLYLNDELMDYIRRYLKTGQQPAGRPHLLSTKYSDQYLYALLKADKQHGVTRYQPTETGGIYRAKYPYGVVEYGELPYNAEQMKEVLATLP